MTTTGKSATRTGGLPQRLYAFVQEANPIALNLKTTGMMCSTPPVPRTIDWLPVLAGGELPEVTVSPFMLRVLASDAMRRVEAAVERGRRVHAPDAPSRATALFAFGDLASVRLTVERHGWDVRELKEFCPAQVARAHRVDMEFVSAAQAAADRKLCLVDEDAWWRAYWSGAGHPGQVALTCPDPDCELPPGQEQLKTEPIWEWLIDGCLRLKSDTVLTTGVDIVE